LLKLKLVKKEDLEKYQQETKLAPLLLTYLYK
jgi:hypothetical protein